VLAVDLTTTQRKFGGRSAAINKIILRVKMHQFEDCVTSEKEKIEMRVLVSLLDALRYG